MRSTSRLVIPVVCLALVAATPAAFAQAIPKSLIRLCLRNIVTGIACYVIGRGGELIVDGSLSAAWAKARESVTGEGPEDERKVKPQPVPPAIQITNPIIEPIQPSDLPKLSKRLHGSASKNMLTEGFLIYDKPIVDPKPLGAKSVTGTTPSLSDFARPKSLLPEPEPSKHLPSKLGDPYLDADAYRARNADKLVPPGSLNPLPGWQGYRDSNAEKPERPLPPLAFGPNGLQIDTLEAKCQRQRERETGLSFLAILGTPDFEAKFKRRKEEVIKPCLGRLPF